MDPAIHLSCVEGVVAAFLQKTLELRKIELNQIAAGESHLSLAFSRRCELPIVTANNPGGDFAEITPGVISGFSCDGQGARVMIGAFF